MPRPENDVPPFPSMARGVYPTMKKVLVFALVLSIGFGMAASPAFAIKEFNDAWTAMYVKDSKNEGFKKLAGDAKCNVCHIQGANKKERNPYGTEAAKLLKKKDFPKDRFTKDAEGCKKEIEAAFKKIEEMKAKDGKTYGEKMKAGELPGGNVEGK